MLSSPLSGLLLNSDITLSINQLGKPLLTNICFMLLISLVNSYLLVQNLLALIRYDLIADILYRIGHWPSKFMHSPKFVGFLYTLVLCSC